MTRAEASLACRRELDKHGLSDWGVRLNQNAEAGFLGMCLYRDKIIVLSAHHIDIHPTPDVINTIKHEVAHALTPGCGHNDVWAAKAKDIGCDNTSPCSNLSLSPEIIDAIRSGATVEVTFDEQVIRTPKYTITRIQDKCEVCGKVAKTESEKLIENNDPLRPDMKIIKLECGHVVLRYIPKGTPFELFQMGGDPTCEHDWAKNECLKCHRYRPYQFQIEGMRFLEAGLAVNPGAAVFDEMGLGKTIQAGGYLKYHPEHYPTLWIVKSKLKYQTAVFIINWLGDDHLPQIINSSNDYLIPGLKHYIVGYDMLVHKVRKLKSGKEVHQGFDIEKFNKIGIKSVVLDECQQIKNVDSTRTQMVRKVVKGRKVIPLSGSPWNNRGSELFPVLNMMDPMKFHSEEGFKRTWVNRFWEGNVLKEGGIRNIAKFKEFTKDLCIRRERTEVLPELPLVNRTKLYVKMSETEEAVYDEAVEEFVKWYEEQAENISGMHILGRMQKMRHLVALCKVPATQEFVDEFIEETDRKIVIFTHHLDVQDMMFNYFKETYSDQMPVLKMVANTSPLEVNNIQEKFNSSPRAIMVASTLAAGEGLNLQTCSDCVLHERQWNPGKEEQAEGRFIRIGSLATSVNATYAHLDGLTTIDPKMDQINERKRRQFHDVHNTTEYAVWNENSFAKDLAESIVNAHNAKKNRKVLANAHA